MNYIPKLGTTEKIIFSWWSQTLCSWVSRTSLRGLRGSEEQGQTRAGSSKLFMQSALACTALWAVFPTSAHTVEEMQVREKDKASPRQAFNALWKQSNQFTVEKPLSLIQIKQIKTKAIEKGMCCSTVHVCGSIVLSWFVRSSHLSW